VAKHFGSTNQTLKIILSARCQWLTPIILATQEAKMRRTGVAKMRRTGVPKQARQIVRETLSQKKTHHKKGLLEWLKVKALRSSPSTTKEKKRKQNKTLKSRKKHPSK
jgi:hypothetical protein